MSVTTGNALGVRSYQCGGWLVSIYDRDYLRMLEDSAAEEQAEQDQLRLDKGRPVRGFDTRALGHAGRVIAHPMRPGRVMPSPGHPS